MCTAEMCTSLVVVSLPGLKVLITNTVKSHASRLTSSYNKSSTNDPKNPSQFNSRVGKLSSHLSSRPQMVSVDDSEFELISIHPNEKQFHGKEHMTTPAESIDLEANQIRVKHDYTVEQGANERDSYRNTTSLPFV
jgi:hypothetical protein